MNSSEVQWRHTIPSVLILKKMPYRSNTCSAETPVVLHDFFSVNPPEDEPEIDPMPAPAVEKECETMESANSNDAELGPPKPGNCYLNFYRTYISSFVPSSYPYLSDCSADC